ncbi:unnamed protein product [Heterobilharzia americana]|nr:unnamed protein product [Heterobilharzia americana]
MKNPRANVKKTSSKNDEYHLTLHRVFSVMPVELANKFMKNLCDDIHLKLEMQTFLETSDIVLQRPNLTYKSLRKNDLFKQKYQIEPMNLINNNPKQMEPKTSLWDSALIDYFVECIKWSTTKWIEEFYRKKSNLIEHKIPISMFQYLPSIDDCSEKEVEKLMCLCTSFTTAYILLRHLQLWQLTNENLVKRQTDITVTGNVNEEDEKINTTCLVASIQFFKSLFQFPLEHTSGKITSHKDNSDVSNLVDFQNNFCGYLSILNSTAGELLVEFFSKHFLNKHHLLERVFGPFTSQNQKLIRIPCPLYFETLLEKFETIDSVWPAPLSEAVPLAFVSKYPQYFSEKVTKWLKLIEPTEAEIDSDMKTSEQSEQLQRIQQQQSVDDEIEIIKPSELKQTEELHSISYERYLTSIDSLDVDELNAIIQVTQSELNDIVKNLLDDVTFSNQELLDMIKGNEIELGKQIIERAKLKINEKNGHIK